VYNQFVSLFNAPASTSADFRNTAPKLRGSHYRRMGTKTAWAVESPGQGHLPLKLPFASRRELQTHNGTCSPDNGPAYQGNGGCRWPFESNGDGSVETGRIEPVAYLQWDAGATRSLGRYWRAEGAPNVATQPSHAGYDDALANAGVRLVPVTDASEIAQLPTDFLATEYARTTTGPKTLFVHDVAQLEASGIVGAADTQVNAPSTAARDELQADLWCWRCDESEGAAQQCTPEASVTLSDGTVVHYRWYKWREQPTMRQLAREFPASYTEAYLAQMQARIEMMHAEWLNGDTKEFLHRPKKIRTELHMAEVEHALVLTPPAGKEVGWVPVETQTTVSGFARRSGYAQSGSGGGIRWDQHRPGFYS